MATKNMAVYRTSHPKKYAFANKCFGSRHHKSMSNITWSKVQNDVSIWTLVQNIMYMYIYIILNFWTLYYSDNADLDCSGAASNPWYARWHSGCLSSHYGSLRVVRLPTRANHALDGAKPSCPNGRSVHVWSGALPIRVASWTWFLTALPQFSTTLPGHPTVLSQSSTARSWDCARHDIVGCRTRTGQRTERFDEYNSLWRHFSAGGRAPDSCFRSGRWQSGQLSDWAPAWYFCFRYIGHSFVDPPGCWSFTQDPCNWWESAGSQQH